MISHQTAEAMVMAASQRLLHDCERIADSRWTESPSSGMWSPAEVVEHVALAASLITDVFHGMSSKLLGTKPLALIDDEIPFVFYRGDEPPGVGAPTGTWIDRSEACERLMDATSALREHAAAVPVDLRTVASSHPIFGRMDGVQWLIFAFAHVERHRADLRRLEARSS